MTLTTEQLSKRWSIAAGTLSNWRSQGNGPKYAKLGRRVIYRLKDVETFEKKHLVKMR